jgi:hypothetical protein
LPVTKKSDEGHSEAGSALVLSLKLS